MKEARGRGANQQGTIPDRIAWGLLSLGGELALVRRRGQDLVLQSRSIEGQRRDSKGAHGIRLPQWNRRDKVGCTVGIFGRSVSGNCDTESKCGGPMKKVLHMTGHHVLINFEYEVNIVLCLIVKIGCSYQFSDPGSQFLPLTSPRTTAETSSA
jgi:hypothetical protein